MFACSILTQFPDSPVLLPLLILCAVSMCLSVPAYFLALRPRRGTTEWFRRLDPPRFAPFRVQGLCWADALWALLAMVCAGALRFFYYVFRLKLPRREDAMLLLSANSQDIVKGVISGVALALALYLLLRTMFGKPLPALLCAILGGFTVDYAAASAAFLILSLLCLYVWMATPYDAPLFFRAFWLAGAGAAYALSLLQCWAAIWLTPFYVGAYIVTQVLRFRGGVSGRRGKKLIASLLWTLFALALGTFLLWLLYCVVTQYVAGSPVELLRSFRFYQALLPTLEEKLANLCKDTAPLLSLTAGDIFLFFAGLAATIPLLHGVLKLRDGRCLLLLCLVPCCLCAWLLSGAYLLYLPLLLILGRLWQIYTERRRSAFAVISFCVVALCFGAGMILNLF